MDIPAEYTLDNGSRVSGEIALCVTLARFAYPNRLQDHIEAFGYSDSMISRIASHCALDIELRYSPNLSTLAPNVRDPAVLADAIGSRCPLQNCIGFIDGTVRGICRPTRNQRLVYNGHKRKHALKFQSVMLPNGIIVLDGPYLGNSHDATILRDSGILEQLGALPVMDDGTAYAVYGDPAYPLLQQLIAPYRGAALDQDQEQFNTVMSKVRESVEFGFGKIVNYFSFVNYPANQKLYLQPVGTFYRLAAILTNAHTILYGSNVSGMFGLTPPTLQEYFTRIEP